MADIARRTLVKGGLLAAGAAALPLGAAAPAQAVPHSPKVLATGLKIPWGMAFLPTGDALVGEKHTRIVHLVAATGGRTVVGMVLGGATKLMGLVLSPSFATDKLLYAHVLTATDARILSMTYRNGVLGTPQVVFSGIPLGTDHHGGAVHFGPDGFMYLTVGDQDTPQFARDPTSLAGKVLRLHQDGSIPADNPFGNAVWTIGHRNMEGLSWDRVGNLWMVEFGESTTDELDRIVKGGDYGWPTFEGGDGPGPVKDPFVTWSPTSTCSPAQLAVKAGYAYVGALIGECLWRVKLTAPNQKEKVQFFFHTYRRIRIVKEAPDGSLWLGTANNEPGRIKAATDDRIIRVLT